MIRNVFAVFFMWFVMYLIGILNGTTVWVSLLIYIAFRYDVHSTSRNMLNGISAWFKDWWKKNGAPWRNKWKAKKTQGKTEGKIPEGYMLIEEHSKICRTLAARWERMGHQMYDHGYANGKRVVAHQGSAGDALVFSYLYDHASFEKKLNNFVEKDEKFMWYDYLGVSPSASEKEINAAFRERAIRHHPDRNPDNKISLHAFQRISNARDTGLARQKKRA